MSNEDDNEPINLLSLDGGGVRGVSSLVILDEIMTKIKNMHGLAEVPKPCDFFHMIGGTSTGGLIAIMLGRLRMSTKEALEEYDKCSAKIFARGNRKAWSISERYRATALQEVVQEIVKERGMGEFMRDPECPKKGKVVVCVMPADDVSKTHCVRSFDGDHGSRDDPKLDPNHDLELGPELDLKLDRTLDEIKGGKTKGRKKKERKTKDDGKKGSEKKDDESPDDNWDKDVLIWEAARATTAASSFFRPQTLGNGTSARAYIDAAIGTNNPVYSLIQQAVDEFGFGKPLGCVVSIGTGTRDSNLDRVPSGWRNIVYGAGWYINLGKTLKNAATDSEKVHQNLLTRLRSAPRAYYRFSVPGAADDFKLNHYKKMPELKLVTSEYLARRDVAAQVRQAAEVLKNATIDHGLAIGHICHEIDPDQVILLNKKARQKLGTTSSFFTGRQDILQRLDSFFALRQTGGKPRREFLLHGMGGVGKSEIALKVSEALHDRFEHQFYIDGSSPTTVILSYAAIARKAGLTGATSKDLRTKALRWMEGLEEEWLMVFDDCNLSDRQRDLPGRDKGSIIYTSRLTSLGQDLPVDCTCEVTPFGEADAIDLLSRASGSLETPENQLDQETAQEVVRELGYLPLAVTQAAAFIRDGNWSLNDYLDKLRDEKDRIISDQRFQGEILENSAVYATLELSYNALRRCRRQEGRGGAGRDATLALKVLNILSFFHHQGFETFIMRRAAEEHHKIGAPGYCSLGDLMNPRDADLDQLVQVDEDGIWDVTSFARGVQLLKKFSLVKLSPDHRSVSMHVLAHTWARKRMGKETFSRWSLVARVLLLESMDITGMLVFRRASRDLLPPHVDVSFATEPPVGLIRDQYYGHLLHKLGLYYGDQKRFLDAKQCLSHAIRLFRTDYQPDCWASIRATTDLARLHHEMGCLSEAELTYREGIERVRGKREDTRAAIELEEQGEPGSPPMSRLSKVNAKGWLGNLAESSLKHFPDTFLSRTTSRLMARPSNGKEAEKPYDPNNADDDLARNRKRMDQESDLWVTEVVYNMMYGELAMVHLDRGRYDLGKRMLLKVVECLEPLLDKYDPTLMRFQIKVGTLTDARNPQFWRGVLNDLRRAPEDAADRFWGSEAAFDLLAAQASSIRSYGKAFWQEECSALFDAYKNGVTWYGAADKRILKLVRDILECLMEGDQYDTAVALATACLRVARATYGEAHMETLQVSFFLFLAMFFQRMGFHDETDFKLLREAVGKARAGLGLDHSLTRRLQGCLDNLTTKVVSPLEPFPEGLDPVAAQMESWRRSKAYLEMSKATLGPKNHFVKRMEHFVGNGPAKTQEELLERLRVYPGPHHPRTKALEREVEMRRAALVQKPDTDLELASSGPSSDVSRGNDTGSVSQGLPQDMAGGTAAAAGTVLGFVLEIISDFDGTEPSMVVETDVNWEKLFGSRVRQAAQDDDGGSGST